MNPVRGRLVKEPSDYTWSSYRAYLGFVRPPAWLETGETLRRFGSNPSEQIRRYRQFVEDEAAGDPLKEMAFGAIVGSARFVNWVREKLAGRRKDAAVSRLAKARPRPSLIAVGAIVSRHFNSPETKLHVRGRRENLVRDVGIFLSRQYAGVSNEEIGAAFGGIGPNAVSMACSRVERRAADNTRFRRELYELAGRVATLETSAAISIDD
jgi:hypothetical protein